MLAVTAQPAVASGLARSGVGPDAPNERVSEVRALEPAPAPQERTEMLEYTIESGDTLYGLSERFEISVETLIWANERETNPDMLSIGQKILVPPVTGVVHTIVAGDTLGGIAQKYKGDVDAIRNLPANHMQGDNPLLLPGQKVIVPGGTKPKGGPPPSAPRAPLAKSAPAPADAPSGGGQFIWPIHGSISQGFRAYHPGLDIGAPLGTPVVAADAGYVAIAGWSNAGYGNHIVIDHGNGFRSLYAHLSRIDVQPGQTVQQGQVIGAVGATGRATGYHLHLEIHQNGAVRNPYEMLH